VFQEVLFSVSETRFVGQMYPLPESVAETSADDVSLDHSLTFCISRFAAQRLERKRVYHASEYNQYDTIITGSNVFHTEKTAFSNGQLFLEVWRRAGVFASSADQIFSIYRIA
jgi:hypothetical protein